MASSVVLKRLLVSANLLSGSFRPFRRCPASSRLFQTQTFGNTPSPEEMDKINQRMEAHQKDRHPQVKFNSDGSRIFAMVSMKDDYLQIRVGLAGLGKDDVKVSVMNNNTLLINPLYRKPAASVEIPKNFTYKFDQITTEMNNGMLTVNLPVVKKEKKMFNIEVN